MTVCPSGQGDGPGIYWALPAGFESPRCRMFGCNAVFFGREKEERAVGQSPVITALFLGLCHGACSVAATCKPPMLVLRVQQCEKECV